MAIADQITKSSAMFQWLLKILIVVSLILPVFLGATRRIIVNGTSMYPTLNSGDWLLVSRWHYRFLEPQRGDVVVFSLPTDDTIKTIKRIVGLPNDTVEIRDGQVYINGQFLEEPYLSEFCDETNCVNSIWIVETDTYFVMGDNRNSSRDSRSFGSIPKSELDGKVIFKYWSQSATQ